MDEISVLDKGYVRFVDHMGSDQRVVESARISYKSPSKGVEQDKKLLRYLYTHEHLSPFEMCKITFNIKLPVFVMRQFVRHRVQNLNEVSARYTQLPNDFYIPLRWRAQNNKNKQGSVENNTWEPQFEWAGVIATGHNDCSEIFEEACNETYKAYEKMIESGVAREMARMILPINIYTEIYTTWDLRNLLHFIRLREDSHAQSEIQEYAKAMKEIARQYFPWTIEIFEEG